MFRNILVVSLSGTFFGFIYFEWLRKTFCSLELRVQFCLLVCCTYPSLPTVNKEKNQADQRASLRVDTRETQQEPVAKQILRRKWGWIGHTLRQPASSTTRQALTWSPQGKRKRGRPRNSWRQDNEVELKQQATNWSGMARAAQKRVRWRGVVDGLCSTGSDGRK